MVHIKKIGPIFFKKNKSRENSAFPIVYFMITNAWQRGSYDQ